MILANENRKIIAGIATLPHREETFKAAVRSIYKQVDEVWAVLNNYEDFPKWLLEMPKIRPVLGHNDFGDAGKMFYVGMWENAFFLSIDDDLLYPCTFVKDIRAKVEQYNGIVSCHGRTYPRPFEDYKKWKGNYRVLGAVVEDVRVDLVGTGCCAFDVGRVKITLSDFKYKNMADVILSVWAHEHNIPLWVMAHKRGYIKYLNPPGKTIWQTERDTSVQTALLKSVLT